MPLYNAISESSIDYLNRFSEPPYPSDIEKEFIIMFGRSLRGLHQSIDEMNDIITTSTNKILADTSKCAFNQSQAFEGILKILRDKKEDTTIAFCNDVLRAFLMNSLKNLADKSYDFLDADDLTPLFSINTDGHPLFSFAPNLKLRSLEKIHEVSGLNDEKKAAILHSPTPIADYMRLESIRSPEELQSFFESKGITTNSARLGM